MVIVFLASIFAALFGTLVGGGSLLTIPLLMFLGLPPHIAIATNRLGVTGLGVAGWYKFGKKKLINYKIAWIIGISALLGSILGANLMLQTNETVLRYVVAGITFVILVFIMAKPKLGIEKTKHIIKNHEYVIGAIIGFFLGIYGGFYGAGVGTFLAYLFILLFGQTFLESAGTRKIPVLLISTMAAIIFAFNRVIVYHVAIVLFAGMFIGSYIGAHYSDRIGNVWIKRLFFVIVLAMVVKLLF